MPDTLVVLNNCCFVIGFICFQFRTSLKNVMSLCFGRVSFTSMLCGTLLFGIMILLVHIGFCSTKVLLIMFSLIIRTARFEGCCYQVVLLQNLTISYEGEAQSLGPILIAIGSFHKKLALACRRRGFSFKLASLWKLIWSFKERKSPIWKCAWFSMSSRDWLWPWFEIAIRLILIMCLTFSKKWANRKIRNVRFLSTYLIIIL